MEVDALHAGGDGSQVSDVVFLPEQLNSVLRLCEKFLVLGLRQKFAAPAVFWPLFPCGGGSEDVPAAVLGVWHEPLSSGNAVRARRVPLFPGDQALDVGNGPEAHQRSAGIFADHEPVWASLLNSGNSLFPRFILLNIQAQVHFPEYLGERCFLILREVAAGLIFLLPPRNDFGQELAHGRFLRLALFRGFPDEQIHKGFLGLPFGSLEGQCGLQGGKAGEVVVPVAAVAEVKLDVFFGGIVVVEDEWVAAVEMERGLSLDVGARVGKVKACLLYTSPSPRDCS